MESLNGKLRNERLNTEICDTLLVAEVLIELRRHHYDSARPRSSLGCRAGARWRAAVDVGRTPLVSR
ncbi:MAG: hypothetical protein CMJ49_05970 [Planctomycetaceae bacterium]|nr:hypothetical protein [Planctomycetaceae bacterium]